MNDAELAQEVEWALGRTQADRADGQPAYLRCGCKVRLLTNEAQDAHATIEYLEVCLWHAGYLGRPNAVAWETKVAPDPPTFPRL